MTIEPAFEKSEELNTGSPSGFGMRFLGLCYGTVAYTIFLATFLYAMGFISGIAVPKTVDSGVAPPISRATAANQKQDKPIRDQKRHPLDSDTR